MSKKLKLIHLYPQEMNIYGDMGNVITLKNRCVWRGIDFEIENLEFGSKTPNDGDMFFMGGGQDNDMYKVFEDILRYKKDYILRNVNAQKVFLLICGGLQLFGNYFLDSSGRKMEGLGILPITTTAPGDQLADRCLGNLASKQTPSTKSLIAKFYPHAPSDYLVGFENHSGQTYFDSDELKPLGNVVHGKGNNSTERIEGAKYKNIFASYSHGSLLPKNPHLADTIIGLALEVKYGETKLTKLDDTAEWEAHLAILKKLDLTLP